MRREHSCSFQFRNRGWEQPGLEQVEQGERWAPARCWWMLRAQLGLRALRAASRWGSLCRAWGCAGCLLGLGGGAGLGQWQLFGSILMWHPGTQHGPGAAVSGAEEEGKSPAW